MTSAIYWFRNDLRIEDNPALTLACQHSSALLSIYIHENKLDTRTRWGFARLGQHRKQFLKESLRDLRAQIHVLGSELFEFRGNALEIFEKLRSQFGINKVYCEQIEAPEENEQIKCLQEAGFEVRYLWQSSMLDPSDLPFDLEKMPDVYTQFRQQVERYKLKFAKPVDVISKMPPLPSPLPVGALLDLVAQSTTADDAQMNTSFFGGAAKADSHIQQYFERRLVDTYKQTRNGLIGMDYSSKFSPWLAMGCISARSIAEKLLDYESQHGSNDGTYWLWFELLWRDYFRFIHFKFGSRLYWSKGLSSQGSNPFDGGRFRQWVSGNTGEQFVDAAMHELSETGFLSNRMRQIVASYWIYDMKGDWRAGAAWFESMLIDYDVYSNQGNWLYIAGKGTDPRGGRPFNIKKQAKDHDSDGIYQSMWLNRS